MLIEHIQTDHTYQERNMQTSTERNTSRKKSIMHTSMLQKHSMKMIVDFGSQSRWNLQLYIEQLKGQYLSRQNSYERCPSLTLMVVHKPQQRQQVTHDCLLFVCTQMSGINVEST